MALYLVQHGKNLPKDADPDKGLSEEGIAEVERMASAAKELGVTVAMIRHSGKKRARQTAEGFALALEPPGGVEAAKGMAPLDNVSELEVRSDENVMLVGHLPFMEKLTAHLVAGDEKASPVFKFQNGGIVCLDKDPDGPTWFITWTLVPRIT